jgi:antitoxin YefM
MLIVSSREFRNNQKKYLDLVDQNKQVIVQRGKNKAYILTPVSDVDRLSVNPKLIEVVRDAEKEMSKGKSVEIKDPGNIWESIES